MEFRDDNWVNLFYLTTLTEYKSLEQFREEWGLKKDEGRAEEIREEIERLNNLRIVKNQNKSFKANMNSQSFVDEIKTFNKAEKHLENEEKLLKHLKTLRMEGNRELLLNKEQIEKIYSDEGLPRENPMRMLCQILKTFEKDNLPEKARLNQNQSQELVEKTKKRIS